MIATPASAQVTIDINPSHVPTFADEFGSQACDGPFEDLPENLDGWHFQLAAGGENFLTLMLTFDSPDGEVTATVTSRDPNNPDSGDGWSGFIDQAGQTTYRHAYVSTDAGWELTDASAEVDEAGQQDFFNLSNTCPGVPDNGNGNGNGKDGKHGRDGTLPETGPSALESATVPLVASGAGLLLAGTLLLTLRRWRRDPGS